MTGAEHLKDWLRNHAGKTFIGATGGALAFSLFWLGGTILGDGPTGAQAASQQSRIALEKRAESAEAELRTSHEKLLADLPGISVDRVRRDQAAGRSVLLNLVDVASSDRDLKAVQAELDARYDFLDNGSRTLTEFLPQWTTSTKGADGRPVIYALSSLTIDPSGVQALDYSYVGLARLDPVQLDDPSDAALPQFVVLQYRTTQDGTLSGLEASLISGGTRNMAPPANGPSAAVGDRPGGTTARPGPRSERTDAGG